MNDESQRQPEQLQQTYVLAPSYFPGADEEPRVNLAEYVQVLWRYRLLILGFTVACALITFLVSQLLPKVYQSRATLLVQPPSFSTELRPAPLSIETYQALIESPYIQDRLRKRLIDDKVIGEDETLENLSTEMFASRDREQPFRPIIDLVVELNEPEKAMKVANTWAEVAVEETAGLSNTGEKGTLDFIRGEYPVAKKRLSALEEDYKKEQDRYQKEIRDLENRWEARITAFKTEWNLDALKQQKTALENRLTADIVKLNDTIFRIKETRDTLQHLREEIKQHPQFLVTSKAITDNALWERIGKDFSSTDAPELQNLKLRTEQLNPVYESLAKRVADTEVLYNTLLPQQEYLKGEINRQEEEIQKLNSLILEKTMELNRLVRQQNTELAIKRRERDFAIGELAREVEGSTESFKALAEKHESAQLAQAEGNQDVKIGARAVESNLPVKPKPVLNTAIALVVGLILSVMGAFAVEFLQAKPTGDRSASDGSLERSVLLPNPQPRVKS